MKKRWILIILAVLFLFLVLSRFTQLEQLKTTLAQGQWNWILLAMLSQLAYYIVFTGSYQSAFYTVNISTSLLELIPVTLGSLFINTVVPAGGAGGAALFTEDLARRGKPAARTATGVLLQLIADLTAFILVLIPGLVYLSIQHDLKSYEIAAAVILVVSTVGLSGLLVLGLWRPEWLRRSLNWSQHTVNWIFGRFNRSLSLANDWAEKNAQEFSEATAAVAGHPGRLTLTVLVAFAAHLLDIITLYFLFMAFNQPVGLGTLVAGYAVGILFLIVAITPQGIGVVEGMMALTFTSLGTSGAAAATITLVFRGFTFWLPMLLGFFAVQRIHTFGSNQRTRTDTWGVRFAAILVALMGVINVLSAVTPSLENRLSILRNYLPLIIQHGGHLTAAFSGFALLMLARGLARRKHVAWLLTLSVLAISVVSHLVKGLDYEEALLAAGLAVLLWGMRHHFHTQSDTPSIRQGLEVLAGALVFTLAYGVSGLFLLDRHYSVSFGLWSALRQTTIMFTQFYNPGLVPTTHFGRFFADSIYIVGIVNLSYAGLMLLRPVFIRKPASNNERMRAKEIVEKYGHSSLGRFLLLDDKYYFFTPTGSVIAYAQVGRAAVTLGDPIGPPDDLLPAIKDFKLLCQRNDWLPIFYQTLPETLDLYKQAGFEFISIGEEGIVNLETFSLEGKAGKPLRSPFNKLTRDGYRFMLHEPPISDNLLEELHAISDEWLTMMHGSEKKFSLGWFDNDYIRNSPIGAVHTPEGWISAFANLVPEYQLNEITIDLMRHRPETEPGTMDFLFVSLIQWAQKQGYQGFNLGLSSLSGVGQNPDDPIIEKTMHFVYEHINQFYNFKGLHSYKEKFHPEWSPRYLIYPGKANLTQAWMAVIQANSGDDDFAFKFFKREP